MNRFQIQEIGQLRKQRYAKGLVDVMQLLCGQEQVLQRKVTYKFQSDYNLTDLNLHSRRKLLLDPRKTLNQTVVSKSTQVITWMI